jgi:hypothetical protein
VKAIPKGSGNGGAIKDQLLNVLKMSYTSPNKRFWKDLSLRMNMCESIDDVVYIFWANCNISAALLFRSPIRRSTTVPIRSVLLFG